MLMENEQNDRSQQARLGLARGSSTSESYHLCRSFLSPPSDITPSSPPPAIAMPPPNCFLRLRRDGKCAPRSGSIPCSARGAHLRYRGGIPSAAPGAHPHSRRRSPTPARPRRRVTLARATKGSSGRGSPAAAASRPLGGALRDIPTRCCSTDLDRGYWRVQLLPTAARRSLPAARSSLPALMAVP